MISLVSERAAELEALCREHDVRRLELFGSAAAGQLSEESDLDFLVEFRELPFRRRADAYEGLLVGLERLFSRRVDLIVDSTIRNPYVRENIAETKELLYEDQDPVPSQGHRDRHR